MKHMHLLSYLLGMLAAAAIASAQFVVTDTFSSTNANWGTTSTSITPGGGGSTGALTITTGGQDRVNFTATISSEAQAGYLAYMPWSPMAPYASDWTVSLQVNNTFPAATTGQSVSIGLIVRNTNQSADYLKLVLKSQNPGGTAQTVIHNGLHDFNETPASPFNSSSVSGSGTLQISYAAATQVFTTSYNFGSATTLGTFRVSGGTGNDANSTWTSLSGNPFIVEIVGESLLMSGSSGFSLANGTAWADTFVTTAVPEPSTYAAMFGLAALGFAAWRRRRQG